MASARIPLVCSVHPVGGGVGVYGITVVAVLARFWGTALFLCRVGARRRWWIKLVPLWTGFGTGARSPRFVRGFYLFTNTSSHCKIILERLSSQPWDTSCGCDEGSLAAPFAGWLLAAVSL